MQEFFLKPLTLRIIRLCLEVLETKMGTAVDLPKGLEIKIEDLQGTKKVTIENGEFSTADGRQHKFSLRLNLRQNDESEKYSPYNHKNTLVLNGERISLLWSPSPDHLAMSPKEITPAPFWQQKIPNTRSVTAK